MHCILVEYEIVLTYVDNMSKGRVRSELTDPANRHLYMRSKTEEKKERKHDHVLYMLQSYWSV